MKLAIQHVTTYRYHNKVMLQPHRLMLLPRSTHELKLVKGEINITPCCMLEYAQDVFGNMVGIGNFSGATSELVIASNVIVEQLAVPWPIFSIAPHAHAFPFTYSENDVTDLGALRQPENPDPRLKDWVGKFLHSAATDTLNLLKDVSAGINGHVVYRTRAEEGIQSALETLTAGSGSCRDIAALFIDAVRSLGFGARAVSGYLFDASATGDEAGSTHAWAEVYLPAAGWVAFDPTHGRLGSANLIPVAVGRCNAQLMPVSGGYIGQPHDLDAMTVRVTFHRGTG